MNNEDFRKDLKDKREQYGVSQASEELKKEITRQLERFNPQEPLFLLIDYFRVRFPTTDAENVIKDVLQLNLKYMLHEEYGRYGYEEQYILGDIAVLVSSSPVLGVLLELKGKGCRQMESYLLAQGRSCFLLSRA